ncbi:outer membrane protein assembly factor [Aerophototrophica crusticola]|uniref:Outer membrane protein assembly factor n=1 Tax=Aerophototrophica crusticola TaxID=1709002 RepID=A0A858R844_9PROT|nr:outer membrane protein assembly factor [Rhodospirillaceae bacterium B3]
MKLSMFRRRPALLALAACLAPALACPAPAQEPPAPAPADETADSPAEATPYTVAIKGVEEHDQLTTLLEEVSRLVALREQPPPSPVGLRRRAEADRERLAAALRSAGYFDAVMDIDVDVETSPALVTITIEEGPRYTVSSVRLEDAKGQPLPTDVLKAEDLGLGKGAPARGPDVLAAEDRITPRFAERGYAYARVVDRRLVVDHIARTMDVTFQVDPGLPIKYGDLSIQGLEDVEAKAVRRRIPWKPGDPYRPLQLEEAREDLAELGVFSSVRLRLADQPMPDGTAPVEVIVQERDMRFIGFGATYGTDDGFGANAYWGHRNLLGGAENFRVGATIAGIGRNSTTDAGEFDYDLTATYREPDFLSRNQSLTLSSSAVLEHPDAYRRKALVLSGIVERPISDDITASLGVTFEQSQVTENEQRTNNTLFGIPAALTIDKSNDLLNATSGWRFSAAATPYLAAFGDSSSFTIARFQGSAYLGLGDTDNYVLAGRAVYGFIVGGGLLDVPADKRFYAGGGGSIRGYGYQKVGPRDAENDPQGGLSLFEASIEMRIKVAENIGIVPFIDAGNVYESEYPSLSDGLRYGAGIGVRYYTPVGPIRVDAAVPLRRQSGDNSFQLYVSIGQAF